jgi:hypothetical protein
MILFGDFQMKLEKRIEKCKGKALRDFNPLLAYFHHVFHPAAVFTNFKTFAIIIKEFFLLQFLEKFGIYKIPVVHVDHPLDKKVPFVPEKVTIYLDYINLWVRPLEMIAERLSFMQYGRACKKWMRMFRGLYLKAGEIYHFRLTTTDRPDYDEMREFRQIHALDPHFLCVPSLHIATVSLVYAFYRQLFIDEGFTQEEIDRWRPELYKGAIDIADSVLYVKQHSVNCIPAALYLVAVNYPEYFSEDDARKFLDDMFRNQKYFSEEDADEVRDFMKKTFEDYLEKGKKLPKESWSEPVKDFLSEYEKKQKQII